MSNRRNIKLVLAYDGTDLHGWQSQRKNTGTEKTVQGIIEKALEKIHKEKVKLTGAGRTDSGVHAREQTANFYTSIQSMDPSIFLLLQVLTEQYYFIKTVKKEMKSPNDEDGFPTTNLVYDRQEQKIYECAVYNDDFTTPQKVDMSQQKRIDDDIAFWIKYEAYELVEAYEKGELKGRLKEIAAELDEEDNPVIMLVKSKK